MRACPGEPSFRESSTRGPPCAARFRYRFISLSGFALWGYLQKLCFVSKLATQLNQRVIHAGAAMRSSKPLRGLSLSGFALWEYLPKNCFASKLARSFSANIPAWLQLSHIFLKNPLAFSRNTRYNTSCCDMIAVKREVAAARQVFSVERMSRGRNVARPRNLTTSHCTNNKVCRYTETTAVKKSERRV